MTSARFDAVVMALDPAFGSHGQASAGQRSQPVAGPPQEPGPLPDLPHARTATSGYACWRRGSGAACAAGWGSRKNFRTPKYDALGARFAAWPQLSVLVEALFADKTMKDLVAEGQAHGVPIAAVLTPSRILASEHFQAVGAITDAELVPGVRTDVPTGYFVVDGERCGFRTPAPAAGQDEPRWLADPCGAVNASGPSQATIRSPDCGSSTWASSSPAAS